MKHEKAEIEVDGCNVMLTWKHGYTTFRCCPYHDDNEITEKNYCNHYKFPSGRVIPDKFFDTAEKRPKWCPLNFVG